MYGIALRLLATLENPTEGEKGFEYSIGKEK